MTGAVRAVVLVALVWLGGCTQPELSNQPKYKPYGEAPDWPHGQAAREPPAGTVARETDVAAAPQAMPFPLTVAVLERGRRRFEIFCSPCHDRAGSGGGIVVRHGFPAPPSFHSDALRAMPLRHFYDVMTSGFGRMYSYADRVTPRDRWSIAAYIRALQMSQHMPLDALTAAERARLESEPAP